MSALTTRLSLYKPGGGSTGLITPDETVDIDKINSNMDLIDAAIGFKVCTSASRPASPFTGQPIYETDTKQFRTWDGAAWVTDASSRGTASGYTVASLAALDAISDAVVGDTAAFTAAPSAGISSTSAALMAQAYSGSGASIKWHFVSQISAATLANMDTFIAACVAITDLATAFIVGQVFYVSGTSAYYRFTSTAGAYTAVPGPGFLSVAASTANNTSGSVSSLSMATIPTIPCSASVVLPVAQRAKVTIRFEFKATAVGSGIAIGAILTGATTFTPAADTVFAPSVTSQNASADWAPYTVVIDYSLNAGTTAVTVGAQVIGVGSTRSIRHIQLFVEPLTS